MTQPAYGPVSTITVGSLGDVISSLASGIGNGFAATTGSLKDLATGVNTNLNSLQGSVSNLQSATQNALNQINSAIAAKADSSQTSSQIAAVQSSVNDLSNKISTLTTIAYLALAIAVVLGLIAIALSMRKRS